MRILVFAAALASFATCAFAEEVSAKPAAEAKAPAEQKVATGAMRAPRPGFDRAKYEERMKIRRAEQKAKVIELLKAQGIEDEAKVAEMAEAIEKIYSRPSRPQRPAGMRNERRPGAPSAGEQPNTPKK